MNKAQGALCLVALGLAALAAPASAAFCTPTVLAANAACWPKPHDIAKYTKKLTNTTFHVAGQSPDFVTLTAATNLLKMAQPSLVVVPGTEADLSATVKFATNHRLQLAVRCSGHDFNGRSAGSGTLQINMVALSSVTYDATAQTVTVGGGATWGQVYGLLKPLGRIAVGPNYRTVCVSGCTLGGCHSPVSRQFGLGIDNVASLRLALYNGTIVVASPTTRPWLFNALLGSGANSFGVVVSMVLKTHAAPPKLVRWAFSLPVAPPANATDKTSFTTNMLFNRTWVKAIPATFTAYLTAGAGRIAGEWLYHGVDPEGEGMDFMRPLMALPGYENRGVTNFTSVGDYADAGFNPAAWIQRRLLTNVLAPDSQAFLDTLNAIFTSNPNATMSLFFTYGGQAARGTVGSVPGDMRSGLFQLIFGAAWIDPAEDLGRLAGFANTTAAWFARAPNTYNNQYVSHARIGPVADWKKRFFGDYDALMSAKRATDPCNQFVAEYGVGYDAPNATAAAYGATRSHLTWCSICSHTLGAMPELAIQPVSSACLGRMPLAGYVRSHSSMHSTHTCPLEFVGLDSCLGFVGAAAAAAQAAGS
eukprot:CAMPEP_0202867086 /NCGR_PEP_ID=MMETSP1391-20130828/8657_1 /ASSEMBLY_ACC=CAM_ASM_000867 /TAXON_ID=1034604 /ORGANISM="Chlamydomonas leiostraca, Strain SAG 11-49" /LENGTH=588 /DNA_ID=CAMNT_0049547091 /DNA_START=115 /DNA_END=1882 /DNA_ORIENTATION=+